MLKIQAGLVHMTMNSVTSCQQQFWVPYATTASYAVHCECLQASKSATRLAFHQLPLKTQQKLLVASLERVQKFGLCMCYKHWDLSYNDLLDWAQIPTLKTRRTVAKLVLFAQMVNKSVHTTSSLPETRIMDSRLWNYDHNLFLFAYF